MSHITFALRQAPQSERFFRWQATVISAFASGSLTAALLNLGAAVALAIARSALQRIVPASKVSCHHA